MRKIALLVTLSVCFAVFAGCQDKGIQRQNQALRDRVESLENEKQQLLEEVSTLQSERSDLQTKWTNAEQEAARAKRLADQLKAQEQKLEDQNRELRDLVRNLTGVSVERRREGNFIVMPNDVLFALGEAELNDHARESLRSVAQYLNENPNVSIRIDGHTDGVPVKYSAWEDNYHLSAMRAHAVMEFLVEQGISPDRMFIAGFGPNRPRVEPDSPTEPVAQNRRVEILVIPEGARSISEILGGLEE